MPATDPAEHLNTIHRLMEEVDSLAGERIEAMTNSTFGVLSTDEGKEYEDRRAKILELVKQLRRLEEAA